MAGSSAPWDGTRGGGVGPRGHALLQRFEKQIAGDLQGWPRRNLLLDFRSKVTFALMNYVAKQLRAAEDALPEGPGPSPVGPPCLGGPVFADVELDGWDQEEEYIAPPVRVHRTLPPRVVHPVQRRLF